MCLPRDCSYRRPFFVLPSTGLFLRTDEAALQINLCTSWIGLMPLISKFLGCTSLLMRPFALSGSRSANKIAWTNFASMIVTRAALSVFSMAADVSSSGSLANVPNLAFHLRYACV